VKTGDRVKVRVAGGQWRPGSVKLASANGVSLAVNLDDGSLAGGGGMFVNAADGCVTLLLLQTARGYHDVASGTAVEVEEA